MPGVARLWRLALPARQSLIAGLWGEAGNEFGKSFSLSHQRGNLRVDYALPLLRCTKVVMVMIVHLSEPIFESLAITQASLVTNR
jgi:hypothetical protein